MGGGRAEGLEGLRRKKLLPSDPHQKAPQRVSSDPGGGGTHSLVSGAGELEPRATASGKARAPFYKPRPESGLAGLGAVGRVGYSWLVWGFCICCAHTLGRDICLLVGRVLEPVNSPPRGGPMARAGNAAAGESRPCSGPAPCPSPSPRDGLQEGPAAP